MRISELYAEIYQTIFCWLNFPPNGYVYYSTSFENEGKFKPHVGDTAEQAYLLLYEMLRYGVILYPFIFSL